MNERIFEPLSNPRLMDVIIYFKIAKCTFYSYIPMLFVIIEHQYINVMIELFDFMSLLKGAFFRSSKL